MGTGRLSHWPATLTLVEHRWFPWKESLRILPNLLWDAATIRKPLKGSWASILGLSFSEKLLERKCLYFGWSQMTLEFIWSHFFCSSLSYPWFTSPPGLPLISCDILKLTSFNLSFFTFKMGMVVSKTKNIKCNIYKMLRWYKAVSHNLILKDQ